MKAKEFKDLGTDELIQKEKSFKKELFDLNYQKKIGTIEKPSHFKMIRKNIARIMTILKEREIENGRNSKAGK